MPEPFRHCRHCATQECNADDVAYQLLSFRFGFSKNNMSTHLRRFGSSLSLDKLDKGSNRFRRHCDVRDDGSQKGHRSSTDLAGVF